MTTTLIQPLVRREASSSGKTTRRIDVYHCFNAANSLPSEMNGFEVKGRKMTCSSMTREVFLLRAFEAGAEAVIVLVCPEGACDYLQGNIRARKRVERTQRILDEIGIGGQHLKIYNLPRQDQVEARKIIRQTICELNQDSEPKNLTPTLAG
jgi:F420-non-reducing hydrogenase iron-sulfur subunit